MKLFFTNHIMRNFDLATVKKSPMIQNVFWLGLEALAKYKGIDRDRFPTKELCFEIVATKF
jgi:hypothetical protein